MRTDNSRTRPFADQCRVLPELPQHDQFAGLRFRELRPDRSISHDEKSKPIDSTGTYRDRVGKLVNFSGSRELATFLVDSPEVQNAFVVQLFQHLAKQPPAAFGPDVLPQLRQRFAENQFSVRKLIIDIVRVSSLRGVELQNEG